MSTIHHEYIREDLHNDTVVLFVHGIMGSPNQFRDFVNMLPSTCSIHNILLSGHGGSVRDFSKSSLPQWKKEVSERVKYLSEHYKTIVIVAHSMGALLAINIGVEFPDKVKQLFLMAVPLRIAIKPSAASIKVVLNRKNHDDRNGMPAAYSIEPANNLLEYLGWAPRLHEVLREARRTRIIVSSLNVSTIVFQSKKDEIVSMKSCRDLRGNPKVTLCILPNSMHSFYDRIDYEILLNSFRESIEHVITAELPRDTALS